MRVSISCPASISNFGPAFDTLGMAVNLRNVFYCEESSYYRHLSLTYIEQDLFSEAYKKGCEIFGSFYKIKVKSKNKVPICSGLGSSATAVVAGLIAAACFNNIDYKNEEVIKKIIKTAYEIEGHIDNIAPCLFGNLVSIINEPFHYQIFDRCPYNVFIFLPSIRTRTKEARETLPESYSREDIIYNLQRTTIIIDALTNGKTEILKELVKDKIHQPYRLFNMSILNGIIEDFSYSFPCFLSGSGPAIAVLFKKRKRKELVEVKDRIIRKMRKMPFDFKTYYLRMDKEGVKVKQTPS